LDVLWENNHRQPTKEIPRYLSHQTEEQQFLVLLCAFVLPSFASLGSEISTKSKQRSAAVKLSAMVKKKSTRTAWPYTPEPSPRLEPSNYQLIDIPEEFTMSEEEVPRARPISMMARGLISPSARPTLEDVLNNRAPSPYTLAAYTAFLSQQHCLETLEFTTEAKRYADKYDEASATLAGMPLTMETQEGWELIQDWQRILEIYIKPGAPREINLPSEERDDLIERSYEVKPPCPDYLDAAVKRMYDLMSDSIFIPFCNSLKQIPYAQTYNVMSELEDRVDEPSRLTFDDRGMHRGMAPRRRRSPPNTSAGSFESSRSPPQSHRPTQSSSLSSAFARQSGSRLSTHVSHSSAMSESALTDSSGGADSPPPGDVMDTEPVMTPPTTPPTSELAGTVSHGSSSGLAGVKPHRSESGGWKKAMKMFGGGGKKKNGSEQQ
jgi:hypothetical protein